MKLGKSRQDALLGWDVEYGTQTTQVADFRASKFLVSNQEYLEFAQAGGYEQRQYWTEEGWGWTKYRKATHLVFWVSENDGFRYRTMLEVIDMPWDWLVDVAYLEAKAFCNWKSEQMSVSIRMPTEAEWHALRNTVDTD